MKQVYFIFLALVVSAGSCKSTKESMQSNTQLYDTKWTLKKIYDKGQEELINTKAFIRFDKEKGSAGGNGSCNSFGSNATVNGNEVSFKNIFSTKMYCEDVQKTENKFLNGLEKVSRYELKNKTLFFYNDKELLFEFVASGEFKRIE